MLNSNKINKISKNIIEVSVSEFDKIKQVRLCYDLPVKVWKFFGKINNIMTFERK